MVENSPSNTREMLFGRRGKNNFIRGLTERPQAVILLQNDKAECCRLTGNLLGDSYG